jgi:hypothetical protein
VAVIVAVPILTPVTTPVLLTEATPLSLEVQTTVFPVGVVVAVKVSVFPIWIEMVALSSLTDIFAAEELLGEEVCELDEAALDVALLLEVAVLPQPTIEEARMTKASDVTKVFFIKLLFV